MARYRSTRVLAVYGPSTYLFLSLHFLERHTFLGPSELSCVTLLVQISCVQKSLTHYMVFVAFPSIFFCVLIRKSQVFSTQISSYILTSILNRLLTVDSQYFHVLATLFQSTSFTRDQQLKHCYKQEFSTPLDSKKVPF